MNSLIRLHRWQLDEKRRNLTELERLQQDLGQQVERLDREILEEQQAASQDELRFAFAGYAKLARARRQTLGQSIVDLEAQIKAMREEVADAFRDVKKYETLNTQRLLRVRQAEERRQQIQQDEIALQGFRRRQRAE